MQIGMDVGKREEGDELHTRERGVNKSLHPTRNRANSL